MCFMEFTSSRSTGKAPLLRASCTALLKASSTREENGKALACVSFPSGKDVVIVALAIGVSFAGLETVTVMLPDREVMSSLFS